ncbi:ATP-binding protein [Spirillospora sp. CA-294931]|uniref:ATP-binding protein n=1 Tax=Spirillospora sp. CA-294931 TaxID=3240042 RepID=UPI003D904169
MDTKISMSDELDIACLASATTPGQIRTLLGLQLSDWGLGHLIHDANLVVGELVANAINASPGGEIRVRITHEPGAINLSVWDSSDRRPIAKPITELALADIAPDPQALDPGHDDGTGGWGLPIVEALSTDHDIRPTPPQGKWVWARLAISRP